MKQEQPKTWYSYTFQAAATGTNYPAWEMVNKKFYLCHLAASHDGAAVGDEYIRFWIEGMAEATNPLLRYEFSANLCIDVDFATPVECFGGLYYSFGNLHGNGSVSIYGYYMDK